MFNYSIRVSVINSLGIHQTLNVEIWWYVEHWIKTFQMPWLHWSIIYKKIMNSPDEEITPIQSCEQIVKIKKVIVENELIVIVLVLTDVLSNIYKFISPQLTVYIILKWDSLVDQPPFFPQKYGYGSIFTESNHVSLLISWGWFLIILVSGI